MLHEHFFGGQDFESGKLHELEGHHYDEEHHVARWHHSKFRLHPKFINLDKKDYVTSIECPEDDETIVITTDSKPSFKKGDMVFFRSPRWNSGCHEHHRNGEGGSNYFELKRILKQREKKNGDWETVAAVRSAGSDEIFEDSHFRFYQEDLKTAHSQKMESYEKEENSNNVNYEEEESDAQMDDREKVHSFRKRNLPEHMHGWIRALRQRVRSVSKFVKRDVDEGDDDDSDAPTPTPTGFTALINTTNSIELSITLDKTIGIIRLAGKLTLTFTFAFELDNKRFTLQRFRSEIVATVGGGVSASLNLGNLVKGGLKFPAVDATIPIPTPVPGLLITLTPYFQVEIGITASITFKSEIGKHVAEGELGAGVTWLPGSGWTTKPVKNFDWHLPSLADLKNPVGKLALTVGPKFGLDLGASGALLIGLGGGPTLSFPLVIAITVSAKCTLDLSVTFKVSLGLGVNFRVLTRALLGASWSKDLWSKELFHKCLLGGTTAPPSVSASADAGCGDPSASASAKGKRRFRKKKF
eukprot:TRINITY_DN1177_c0_g1_i6.p1 TRINITY_DN1177_c0_g1~~TRINITY_DN1177_c0_g1_i6.p1  ORF type:complete len:579 (-),score=215.87 TRINITY_DN1177_c0_g1_i6:91-1671(-)